MAAIHTIAARLQALANAGHLDAATVRRELPKVELQPASLAAVSDRLETDLTAPQLLSATLPLVAGNRVAHTVLDVMAGADRLLQQTEIDHATALIAERLVLDGEDPVDASTRARRLVLTELGARPGGRTVHAIDAGEVAAIAEDFGEPFYAHSQLLGEHLGLRLLRETRHAVAGKVADDPDLAETIAQCMDFLSIADELREAGRLEAVVADLARTGPTRFRPVYAEIDQSGDYDQFGDLDDVEAVIVDADDDGRLTGRDAVAYRFGPCASIVPMDADEAQRVRVAAATRQAIDLITQGGNSPYEFYFYPPKINTEFWEVTDSEQAFQLRAGQSAAAAVADLINNPQNYAFECGTAISVVWHIAQLLLCIEEYGDDANAVFDRRFGLVRIGPLQATEPIVLDRHHVDLATDAPLAGDWRYFETRGAGEMGKWRGWRGENVLYYGIADRDGSNYSRGDELYFGHPFGLVNAATIVDHLNGERYPVRSDALPLFENALQKLDAEIERTGRPELRERREQIAEITRGLEESAALKKKLATFMNDYGDQLDDARNWFLYASDYEIGPAGEYLDEVLTPTREMETKIEALDTELALRIQALLPRVQREARARKARPLTRAEWPELEVLQVQERALSAALPQSAALIPRGKRVAPVF